jgi:hypothetical protein
VNPSSAWGLATTLATQSLASDRTGEHRVDDVPDLPAAMRLGGTGRMVSDRLVIGRAAFCRRRRQVRRLPHAATLGQHPGSNRSTQRSRGFPEERQGSSWCYCACSPSCCGYSAIPRGIQLVEDAWTNSPVAMVRMGSPVRFRRGAPPQTSSPGRVQHPACRMPEEPRTAICQRFARNHHPQS